MKLSKRHILLPLLLISVAFILGLLWYIQDWFLVPETASTYQTAGWSDWKKNTPVDQDTEPLQNGDSSIPDDKKAGILLRSDDSGLKLLLKHSYGKELYSYDSGTKTLNEVSEEKWSKAKGKAAICWSQMMGESNKHISLEGYPKYEIKKNGGNILNAYGRYSEYAAESLDGTKVAVVSTNGALKPSLPGYPGLGGSEPELYGQRYLQIISLSDGKTIRGPIRLDTNGEQDNYRLCWSKDNNFLVVYRTFTDFSVIQQ